MEAHPQYFETVIIGTGFSGLLAAIRLKQHGLDDFVLLERSAELGGTWRDNSYPGAPTAVRNQTASDHPYESLRRRPPLTPASVPRAIGEKPRYPPYPPWAHDGVREILRPVSVVQDMDDIFVEVDMDFVASKERPEFPFGHLLPGDIVTVKFLAHYSVNPQGKITQLQTMTWEPERGISKIPKLGTHAGQQAAFYAYMAAFSAGLAPQYSSYYTDDVTLVLPSAPALNGKQAIVEYYSAMAATVREAVEVQSVIFDDHAVSAHIISNFTAVADAPDFPVGALQQGQAWRVPLNVNYSLRDGLISRIEVSRLGEPTLVEKP